MYGYYEVFRVDLVELANFLEFKGRKGAICRWNKLKNKFTQNGENHKMGFTFGFQDSAIEELIVKDIEYKNDISMIQKSLNVPVDGLLLCRIYGDFALKKITKINDNPLPPLIEKCNEIHFFEMCYQLEGKRPGFQERRKQIIKLHSRNYNHNSYCSFEYSKKELSRRGEELLLDGVELEKKLEEENIQLRNGDKIEFFIDW